MKLFRISTVPISLNILLKGQLKYLNQFYEVTAISGAGKDLDEVREREEVKIHPLKIARPISPFQDVVSLWKLYRYFKKEKPHIIHSITPKAGLLSMIAGKMAGVPVRMHTFKGLIFPHKEGHFQTLLIWMDRTLCYFATHVYPEGRGVREDLLRYRITDKPLTIIANGNVNGTDTAHFSSSQITDPQGEALRAALGILPGDFVFVFVGRLVTDKGINELVTAFKNLASTPVRHRTSHTPHPATKLLLVGPMEHELDALHPETLTEIQGNPDIISVGFQPDVRPYFAISHALVLPSYREGFPNAVLQAGAMELPAIVTDINGCNEIITEGENGLIIPVKDAAALQQAMEKMVSDTEAYEIMKAKARPLIESRYRQEVVWKALLEEYRRVTE
ncbi:MAG: glycosyltransferase family 4 protein [Flavobacteriales bacterium]|jgi:Glycosyltransferase|nr:glycosyltransferase family 4 protein [Flavobacteriales bacterium]MCA0390719.1 glycosyltransferase family 4 protein [Bacteroidota bacterium]